MARQYLTGREIDQRKREQADAFAAWLKNQDLTPTEFAKEVWIDVRRVHGWIRAERRLPITMPKLLSLMEKRSDGKS